METISLSAKTREIKGKQVKQLRAQDKLPAEVYGHGVANQSVTLDTKEFLKVWDQAGESTLVDLAIDGDKPAKVLIGEIQRDPLTGQPAHVDLRQVKMDEKLEAEIELEFINEAPAIKELGAILVKNLDSVTAYCLPTDLVSSIAVDLSGLKQFGDAIRVADLPVPSGIEFVNEPDDLVVIINEPISQAELDALEKAPEAADVSQVEVAGEAEKAAKAAAEAGSKE